MDYELTGTPALHRRRWSRLTTDLPARATTLFDTRPATLLDISLGGAKVFIPAASHSRERPELVGEVLIEWCGFEGLGRAVWQVATPTGACAGVRFDPALQPPVVIATRNRQDEFRAQGGPETVLRYHARKWSEGG